MELEEDRLSSLPKIILHNILSRIPDKDAARTCVLSQVWLDTWNTFPMLSFCDTEIVGMSPPQPMHFQPMGMTVMCPAWRLDIDIESNDKFCDYVRRRMLRFRDQNLAIKEFTLKLKSSTIRFNSNNIDTWLKSAGENGVEVINFSQSDGKMQELCENPDSKYYYVLPTSVIEAKSLTKLVLHGGIRVDSTFMNHHSIKFLSLRELSMSFVLFGDEQTAQNLISCCPLIEYITLKYCSVLRSGGGILSQHQFTYSSRHQSKYSEVIMSLSMSGLQKLKGVYVSRIKEVFVDALSLESLHYSHDPMLAHFDRCKNLKNLYLCSVTSTFFTNKWFLELFSKFPFLERLSFDYCKMSEKIDISSVRLKVLELLHCHNLKEVNIDAPNLLSCGYNADDPWQPTDAPNLFPIISFLRNSSHLVVNILSRVHSQAHLCKVRKIVQNMKPHNVLKSISLDMDLNYVDAFDPVVLPVLYSIKHLDLLLSVSSRYDETLFSSTVDILLSTYCPSTISFKFKYDFFRKSEYDIFSKFIEFFYDKLMERKDDTRCWWHGLKNVKVTSSMKIDEKVDLKTILELLPTGEKISFILEF